MNDAANTENKNIKRKRPTLAEVDGLKADIATLEAKAEQLETDCQSYRREIDSLRNENDALRKRMGEKTLHYREALEQISLGAVSDPKKHASDALLAARMMRD